MQILCLDEIDSTQGWLKDAYKSGKITLPLAVYAKRQTSGVGSRGNSWIGEEGNLFLSFVIEREKLPGDLKIESASIYFAYQLKEVLGDMGSNVWIKWPNDFYMEERKVGGMITSVVSDSLICGVGLNLVSAPEGFGVLDIQVDPQTLTEKFVRKIEKFISWKQVFRNYSVEFYKNKSFYTHIGNEKKVSLVDARLEEDGSIVIEGERIYSLR